MSTSKRRPYHHGDLRSALTDLAVDALERNGPEKLTIRGLAAEAGVSGMAPYRHFADKAALMAAVARRGFQDLRLELAVVDDNLDPERALTAFGIVYVKFARERPGLFRLMFGGLPPTEDEELTSDPQTVFGLFSSRLAQIVAPERRRVAFIAAWSAIHGLASLIVAGRIRGPASDPAELARQIALVTIDGLKAHR